MLRPLINHRGTRPLQTNRLLLRQFTRDDAGAMFANWANDPDVCKYLSWPPHGDISVTQALLETWVADYENENFYNWAIVFQNAPIGSIGLLLLDEAQAEAEVGFCLSKAHWSKGIMTEALRAVLDFAFSELGCKRLHAKHHVDNSASGKVLKKCGMRYIETKLSSPALNPDKHMLCDCYEICQGDIENI